MARPTCRGDDSEPRSDSSEQILVSAMVNEFAKFAEPLIVVIDDDHLIDDGSVHRAWSD